MKHIYIIIILLSLLSCNSNRDIFRVSSLSMAPNLDTGDIVKMDASVKTYDYEI